MKRTLLVALALIALAAVSCQAAASGCNGCAHSNGIDSCAPAGGWFPYGGGILSWWPRGRCFPCCGAPDDYCQKPLPCVCWPPYSADFKYADSGCVPPQPCSECVPARDLNE